jgi:hypothetical protein
MKKTTFSAAAILLLVHASYGRQTKGMSCATPGRVMQEHVTNARSANGLGSADGASPFTRS